MNQIRTNTVTVIYSTYPAESRKLTLTFLPEPINSTHIRQSVVSRNRQAYM